MALELLRCSEVLETSRYLETFEAFKVLGSFAVN